MLICEVTGEIGPQEYLWEKQGSPGPLQKRPNSILLFRPFNKTHLGTYTCTATGPQGTVVATYSLWINGRHGTEGTRALPCSPQLVLITPCHPVVVAPVPGADAGGHLQPWQEQPPLSRLSQTWWARCLCSPKSPKAPTCR